MKLALDTKAVIGLNGNGTRLRYRTNTEPGASGSPVFTVDWSIVALHHYGDVLQVLGRNDDALTAFQNNDSTTAALALDQAYISDPGTFDGRHQAVKTATMFCQIQMRQLGDFGRLLVHRAFPVSEMHKSRGITRRLTQARVTPCWVSRSSMPQGSISP